MIIFGISISMPVFWLILALILLAVEALTAGLATIWFAAGSVLAFIVALLELPITVQVIIFFLSSILLLVFTRKIFVEKLKTGSEKTNVEALIGQTAIVVGEVLPYRVGQIKVNGLVWSAISQHPGEQIAEQTLVRIVAIDGVKTVVVPIEK